jgi:hypothetical protein
MVTDAGIRHFVRIDDSHYQLVLDHLGVAFDVARLRRRFEELYGELTVTCELGGARTYDGVLSVGDFNLSNIRARQDRAKYLAQRAQTRDRDVDWLGLLEEFAQRVLAAERAGGPAVSLRELPRPTRDETLEVEGLPLLPRHPVILFGDGGAAKSYIALYLAGRLAERDHRVGLFNWELAGEDHEAFHCWHREIATSPAMLARDIREIRAWAGVGDQLARSERDQELLANAALVAWDGEPF